MWSPNPGMPPFSCKIENPSKEKKLGGLKQFIEYKIQAQVTSRRIVRADRHRLFQIPGGRFVGRRYKQFDWLHEQLVNKFRFICIPPLPGKQVAGNESRQTKQGQRVVFVRSFVCGCRPIRRRVHRRTTTIARTMVESHLSSSGSLCDASRSTFYFL